MTLAHRSVISISFITLMVALLVTIVISISKGAVNIAPFEVVHILLKKLGLLTSITVNEQNEAVIWAIRLPRVLQGVIVGATLAAAGVVLQGLFRNPLADSGLLGISSGASFFVAVAVVLQVHHLGLFTLPVAAFIGSTCAILLVSGLSHSAKRTQVTSMLLAGIALNSFFMAGTGLATYFSTDEQLRTITFWQMGSLASASWSSLSIAGPFMLISILGLPLLSGSLNALLLGEDNAQYLGVRVERLKWCIILLVAMGVGASVAISGLIGFVGLIVPHLVRMVTGPNHKLVIPGSILVGAILLTAADLLARTVITPQELPIGLMTSLLGAPFFLYLILREKRRGLHG